MTMTLPIQKVPGHARPPRFRWLQRVDTINGPRVQVCEGQVHPSIEASLIELIALAERQEREIESLRKDVLFLKEKVGAAEKQSVTKVPAKGKK